MDYTRMSLNDRQRGSCRVIQKEPCIHYRYKEELLLACIGGAVDTLSEQLSNLTPANWKELTRLFDIHGIGPLVYNYLNHVSMLQNLPPEACQWLKTSYQKNGARNFVLYSELNVILSEFNRAQIPVIVLKGAYLAEVFYDDISLRQMSDIDILIRMQDMDGACDVMQRLGYNLDKSKIPIYHDSSCHLPPFRKPGAFRVEIHRSIDLPQTPFQVDVRELWERMRPVVLSGVPCHVLCAEDLLLHLCIHLYQDRFKVGLRHFYDIRVLFDRYGNQLDLNVLKRRAKKWGMNRPFYLGLYLSDRFFNIDIPIDWTEAEFAQDINPTVIMEAKELIFPTDFENLVLDNFAKILAADTPLEKIKALLRKIFPSKSFIAQKFSLSRGSLRNYLMYYPRWFLDTVKRYWLKKNRRTITGLLHGRQDVLESLDIAHKKQHFSKWMGYY